MRRLLLTLCALPLLGAEDGCGSDSDTTFGGGGSSSSDSDDDDGGDDGAGDDGSDDGGSDEGGDDGGSSDGSDDGEGSFLLVSVDCEGDNTEYTWTYAAELDFAASYVTVTVDPGTASYEAWYLEDVGGDGATWQVEVTELLSSRDCSVPGELLWEAFGFGEWSESTESSYSP